MSHKILSLAILPSNSLVAQGDINTVIELPLTLPDK